jgi:thioesterase domain-containing protein
MAQQLKEQGKHVSLLAMVEPSAPRETGIGTYLRLLSILGRRIRWRLSHHTRKLVELTSSGQREYTRQRLKVIANLWATRRYTPRPYSGRLEIFLTEASLRRAHNRQAAWREFAEAGAIVHDIPGSHATIVGLNDTPIEAEHMQILAEKMNACIERALQREL